VDVEVAVDVTEEVVIVMVVVVATLVQQVRIVTKVETVRIRLGAVEPEVTVSVGPVTGVDSVVARISADDYLGRLCFWLGLCMDLSMCIVWLR